MVDLNKDIARINEFVKSIEEDGFGENEGKVLVLRNGIVLRAWEEDEFDYIQLYDAHASSMAYSLNLVSAIIDDYKEWYLDYIKIQVAKKENIYLPGEDPIVYTKNIGDGKPGYRMGLTTFSGKNVADKIIDFFKRNNTYSPNVRFWV